MIIITITMIIITIIINLPCRQNAPITRRHGWLIWRVIASDPEISNMATNTAHQTSVDIDRRKAFHSRIDVSGCLMTRKVLMSNTGIVKSTANKRDRDIIIAVLEASTSLLCITPIMPLQDPFLLRAPNELSDTLQYSDLELADSSQWGRHNYNFIKPKLSHSKLWNTPCSTYKYNEFTVRLGRR